MAHTVNKGGGGEPNPLDNQLLTSDGLKNKLAQLGAEHLFYELEAVEVVDIFRQVPTITEAQGGTGAEETTEPNLSGPGAILGRYVFSEHGDRPSELQEFFPLNSNILQMPIVGEIVLGFSDEATQQRYYFGRLNTNIDKVNFQNFNLSSVGEDTTDGGDITPLNSGSDVSEYRQGNYFSDTFQSKEILDEGDTAVKGRFGNSIILGSNQRGGEVFSPNIKLKANISGSDIEEDSISSKIQMTTNEKLEYSEPTKTEGPKAYSVNTAGVDGNRGFDIDYSEPQIIFDSDRIVLNAKSNDIGIFAKGKVFIKGENVSIKNSEAITLVTKSLVADTSAGVKKDITKKLNDIDGDTKLLPENILPMAEAMKPHIANINNGVISAASKILPPVIAPGTPNPLNLFGHLQDLRFFENQLEEVKKFFKFEWLNKREWKTVSLNEVTEALGLNELDSLPANNVLKWEEFFDDIDAAKAKVENIQAQAAAAAVAVAALNAAFDVIQNGGGSTQTIIEALDAYEADPNNPPVDTTDIRDVIADGADTEDVKRYLDFGGSPQVRELLISSKKREQDAQKLSSMGIIADLINEGMNL